MLLVICSVNIVSSSISNIGTMTRLALLVSTLLAAAWAAPLEAFNSGNVDFGAAATATSGVPYGRRANNPERGSTAELTVAVSSATSAPLSLSSENRVSEWPEAFADPLILDVAAQPSASASIPYQAEALGPGDSVPTAQFSSVSGNQASATVSSSVLASVSATPPSSTLQVSISAPANSGSASTSASSTLPIPSINSSNSSLPEPSCSPYRPSETDVDISNHWKSLGCVEDDSARDPPSFNVLDQNLTTAQCLAVAFRRGYSYAALRSGRDCYGGSAPSLGFRPSEGCDGDLTCLPGADCGVRWPVNLYMVKTAQTVKTTDTGASEGPSATSERSGPAGATDVSGHVTDKSEVGKRGLSISGTTSVTSDTAANTTPVSSAVSSAVTSATTATNITTTTEPDTNITTTTDSGTNATTPTASGLDPTITANTTTNTNSTTTDTNSTTNDTMHWQAPIQPQLVCGVHPPPPSDKQQKVWGHFMVGFTVAYKPENWDVDIAAAKAAGIDGFALNMGNDPWQHEQVRAGYDAAKRAGNFSMFLSMDLNEFPCSSAENATDLVNIVLSFAHDEAQAKWEGKVLVSTFAGQQCSFGHGNGTDPAPEAWGEAFVEPLREAGVEIFFVPSLFLSPWQQADYPWLDGTFAWNSAWPGAANATTGETDAEHLAALEPKGKLYVPALSPAFFAHYGPDSWDKNWVYRGDDWLYCTRWEALIALRDRAPMLEIVTWNDFTESTYIAPYPNGASLDPHSPAWVEGMDHEPFQALTKFYAEAYKTGHYPQVLEDSLVLWSRPHPKHAPASNDTVERPRDAHLADDALYAVVLAKAPASVVIYSGPSWHRFYVPAGLSKMKIQSAPGPIGGFVERDGWRTAGYDSRGKFEYTNHPERYNFNYFVGASAPPQQMAQHFAVIV